MLQVIKAEDVRDGEPRWWCPDDAYAARTLEWIVTGNLHTEWRREADAFTLAIVDRPAPTPTPAPGLDLDAVERAERAMTPGPWEAKIYTTHVAGTSQETQWHEAIAGGPSSGTVVCETEWSVFEDESAIGAANIRGIVALRNAAPALIAEVRALRAAAEEREADMHARIRAGYDKTVADAWRAEVAKRDAEIARLTAELAAAREAAQRDRDVAQAMAKAAHEAEEQLAAARAVPAEVEAAIDGFEAMVTALVTSMTGRAADDAASVDAARNTLRTAIARAIDSASIAAIDEFRAILTAPRPPGLPCPACKAAAPPATVGGLLAAGEERESRAWSEKGETPPGSCPFCASRISMVQRDGYFIARCSHRGCGAVGPRMRSVSRAADLFCQPPRREAQGMSCGPIVASPPRPRCSCTHEAGDSRCNVHPTCSECGASTTRPVDGCEACRGPLPKGG